MKINISIMQHIQEILNAKRLNKEKILGGPVSISVKYDGTALQYSRHNFYKRPYKPSEVLQNKKISDFDLVLNEYYNEPINHLMNKGIFEKCDEYDVVNFEIINNDLNHTIDYSGKNFKNGLILLSAYKNGKEVDFKELSKLARKLDVSLLEELVEDQTLESIGITYQMLDDNKDDISSLFEIFKKRLSNIANIDNIDNIEGFVITAYDEDGGKTRKYKVINPLFKQEFEKNREKDIESKSGVSFNNLFETFNVLLTTMPKVWYTRIKGIDGEFEKRMYALSLLLSKKQIQDALMNEYLEDEKASSSEFSATLNIDWLKQRFSQGIYDPVMNFACKNKKCANIVYLFLIGYKRTHANNVFNVEDETNEDINDVILQVFR